jgi:hypothetical protein
MAPAAAHFGTGRGRPRVHRTKLGESAAAGKSFGMRLALNGYCTRRYAVPNRICSIRAHAMWPMVMWAS